MGQGFVAGALWGAVCGAVVLVVGALTVEPPAIVGEAAGLPAPGTVTVEVAPAEATGAADMAEPEDAPTADLPRPTATAVEVPAGSEFDRVRPDTDPSLPGAMPLPEVAERPGVAVPDDAVEDAPSFDTATLEIPQLATDGPTALGVVPEVVPELPADPGGTDEEVTVGQPVLDAPDVPASAPEAVAEPESMAAPEIDDAPVDGPTGMDFAGTVEPAPELAAVSTPEAVAAGAGPERPEVPDFEGESLSQPEAEDVAPEVQGGTAPETPTRPERPQASGIAPPAVTSDAPDMAAPEDGPAAAFDAPDIAVPSDPGAPETPVEPMRREASVETGPAPEAVTDAPEGVETPAVDDDGPALIVPEISEAPVPESAEDQVIAQVEVPDVGEFSGGDALPSVGGEADAPGPDGPTVRLPPGFGEAASEPVETAEPAGALEANRAAWESRGLPRVAVVLIAEGSPEAVEIPAEVTIGMRSGDAVLAREWRDSGREIVLMPEFPEGAAPSDVEVALGELLRTFNAVALMDAEAGNFGVDRAAAAQVVDVARAEGLGLITFPRGFNTIHGDAEEAGVPSGLIQRVLEGDAAQMGRALDRAAFRASAEENGVIVVGYANAATAEAVTAWASGRRAETVELAPVSGVLAGDRTVN